MRNINEYHNKINLSQYEEFKFPFSLEKYEIQSVIVEYDVINRKKFAMITYISKETSQEYTKYFELPIHADKCFIRKFI